jgi:hypothetical protein
MAKKGKGKTSIFITCEGSNTEPLYFEKIKEVMEDADNYPYAIRVYPEKNVDEKPKTDPIGLIKVAIEEKKNFDEQWVVFDNNGYTKHQEAFQLAKENNINIAFSGISFETWVLLHFERNSHPFAKSVNIIDEKFHRNEKYIENYAKSGDYYVYPYIEAKTEDAFVNTSWLRNWQRKTNSKTPYTINPYTDVDFLVQKLMLDDWTYECREIGQSVNFQKVEIVINNINNEYVAKITNNTNKRLIWNEFDFYNGNMNKINISNSVILSKGTSENNLGQIVANSKIFVEFRTLKLEVSDVSL